MWITREWLDFVSDEQGLTKGQQELLMIHCGGHPFVDKEIPDFVANFIEKCKGYRGLSEELKNLIWKEM